MTFALEIIFAFALGYMGVAATAPVEPAQTVQVVEVDPILAMDAETTLDDYSATSEFNDEAGNHYIAQYIGSDESSDSMYAEFTYESIDFPGTFHHYTYSILKFA